MTTGLTYQRLQRAMTRLGFPFFDQGDYNLNLIGIRTDDNRADLFNDWIIVAFRQNDHEQLLAFQATTDPGTYYRQNPINVDGTAILRPGHYPGMFRHGYHRGEYPALVQNRPVTVYRDKNRDGILDTGESIPVQTGNYGINLHRAHQRRTSATVDRWSAGCQVLANPHDFDLLMAVARRAAAEYGPVFSYTLLTEQEAFA